MSTQVLEPRPAVPSVPFLTGEQAAALPPRRSWVLRVTAAVAAGALTLAYVLVLESWGSGSGAEEPSERLLHFLAGLGPWLICVPWMRRLDVRRVPWFFLCVFLGFFFAPWLVGMVVSRRVGLPYRDWPVQYWHVPQARNVPGMRAWTVVVVDAAHRYRPQRWDRMLSFGWALVIMLMIPLFIYEGRIKNEFGWVWLALFAAVAVGTTIGDFVESRRDRARAVSA